MSLTSYRAAPPRVGGVVCICSGVACWPLRALRLMPRVAQRFRCCVLLVRRWVWRRCVLGLAARCRWGFRGPGGDRLSRTLGCSIMGAGGFHVRVRDGIGCGPSAMATRSSEPPQRGAPFSVSPCIAGWIGFWCGLGVRCAVWRVLLCGHPGPRAAAWMAAVHGGWGEPIGRLGPVS